jgi:hypothetical protein
MSDAANLTCSSSGNSSLSEGSVTIAALGSRACPNPAGRLPRRAGTEAKVRRAARTFTPARRLFLDTFGARAWDAPREGPDMPHIPTAAPLLVEVAA